MQKTRKPKPLSIEDLSKVSTVYDFDVSRANSNLALTWDKEGFPNVYFLVNETSAPVRLTQGTESSLSPAWSPDGSEIAFISDRGGNESFNIFRINIKDRGVANLTNDSSDNNTPIFSPTGSKLAFISNKDGVMLNLYVMNANGSEPRQITKSRIPISEYCWSPEDEFLAYTKGFMESEVWLCKADGSEDGKLIAHSKAEDIVSFQGWSPDGKTLAFVSNSESGYFDVGLCRLSDSETTWFEKSSNEKFGPVWSPDGSKIAYLEIIDCNQVIKVKDVEKGVPRMVSPRVGVSSGIKWSRDGSKIFFTYTSPKNPRDLWVTDLFSNAYSIITTLPSKIDEKSLMIPEVVRYRSFDGLSIQALLYKPRGNKKKQQNFTSLVYPHGGPEAQAQVVWHTYTQYLVSNGYLVIEPNYRGSTGYGRKFVRMADRDLGGDDIKDIVSAGDYLVEEGLANEDGIGIYGGSYGGYATMMALTKYPKKFRAGVAIVPFVNWKTEFESEREYLRFYDEHKVGKPEDNPEFYFERSPINFIENIEAPLLLIAGMNDPRCPIGESQQIVDRMKALGKVCEYIFYEDEGHGFRKVSNKIDACKLLLKFLQK